MFVGARGWACCQEGKKKPGTFDFLGFTHFCSTSRKGKFRVKRKTSWKKYRAKIVEMNKWIRLNRHMPARELVEKLREKLEGYYQYYAITDNLPMVDKFRDETKRLLYKWLNRRSQRKSFDWDKFVLFMHICQLPRPDVKVNIYELRSHLSYIM